MSLRKIFIDLHHDVWLSDGDGGLEGTVDQNDVIRVGSLCLQSLNDASTDQAELMRHGYRQPPCIASNDRAEYVREHSPPVVLHAPSLIVSTVIDSFSRTSLEQYTAPMPCDLLRRSLVDPQGGRSS